MARRTSTPDADDWALAGRGEAAIPPERRPGFYLGPLRITPIRLFAVLALIGSFAYLAYAILLVRDTSAIPMLAAGAVVLGIVFMILAMAGGRGTLEAGREGSSGRAMFLALAGGVAAIIAFGCFAAAIILVMVLSGG